MLEINTNDLGTRQKALIDGHPYIVRKLGAGDELAISQIIRELTKIQKRADKTGGLSDEDELKFHKLQERSLKIYASTFDDGGDGTKSLQLLSSLSFEERARLYEKIFGESELKAIDEVPEDSKDEQSTEKTPVQS